MNDTNTHTHTQINWINKLRMHTFSHLRMRRMYKIFFTLLLIVITGLAQKAGQIDFYWTPDSFVPENLSFLALALLGFFLLKFSYRKLTTFEIGWERMNYLLEHKMLLVEGAGGGERAIPIVKIERLTFELCPNNLVKLQGYLFFDEQRANFLSTSFPFTSDFWNIWREQVRLQGISFRKIRFKKSKFGWLNLIFWLLTISACAISAAIFAWRIYVMEESRQDRSRNRLRAQEKAQQEAMESAERAKTFLKPVLPDEIPITFSDVGGYDEVKNQLLGLALLIRTYPDNCIHRGIVLYGPSGTGKTMLAKVFAKQVNLPFFAASGGDIQVNPLGKAMGANDDKLINLFETVHDYIQKNKLKKAILFIDEFDNSDEFASGNGGKKLKDLMGEGEGGARKSGLSEKFKDIVLIVTTNNLDWFEIPALRPGRLSKHFEVDFPDEKSLAGIIKAQLKIFQRMHPEEEFALSLEECQRLISKLIAKATEGKRVKLAGADIEAIVFSLPGAKKLLAVEKLTKDSGGGIVDFDFNDENKIKSLGEGKIDSEVVELKVVEHIKDRITTGKGYKKKLNEYYR